MTYINIQVQWKKEEVILTPQLATEIKREMTELFDIVMDVVDMAEECHDHDNPY